MPKSGRRMSNSVNLLPTAWTDAAYENNLPGNYWVNGKFMPRIAEDYYKSQGYSDDEIKQLKDLMWMYGQGGSTQKNAMNSIQNEIKNDTHIGKLLQTHANIETQMYKAWLNGNNSRMKSELSKFKKDNADYMSKQDMKSTLFRMKLDYQRQSYLYRKGTTEGIIQSWTTNYRGAHTGAQGRLTPNNVSRFSALEKKGFKVLNGGIFLAGAPGESELTLINMKALK